MKKLIIITVSFLTSLQIQNVFAQTSNFDGFYSGISAGYMSGKDRGKEYDGQGAINGYGQLTKPKGLITGIDAGFNKLLPNDIIIGAEISFSLINKKHSSAQYDSTGTIDERYPVNIKVQNKTDIKAKLGYIFNNNQSLAYLTTGLSFANIKRSYDSQAYDESSSKNNVRGNILGFGMEHLLNKQLTLKAEFFQTKYKDTYVDTSATNGVAGYLEQQSYKDKTFKIGLNYYFK